MGLWQCPICTYHNDDGLLSCDICGVFRDSNCAPENNEEKKAPDTGKGTEASILAKALFARKSRRAMEANIALDDILRKEGNGTYGKGETKVRFDALQKAFMATEHNSSVNIVPFRFDTLSPDDIVLFAKKSSKIYTKGDPAPFKAPANIPSKKGILKFSPKTGERHNSSGLSSKSRNHDDCESNGVMQDGDGSQILSNNLHRLKLDKESANNTKVTSLTEYRPEKWILSNQEGTLSQLNLAIVGHVDSGKSTLSGRLLHLLGRISKKVMHKYEKEAKEKGKGSFAYAWAMDESNEERERGITMTVAVAYFETEKYRVVLLDSPGHKDFVPNMISGVTQADAAILVVDASIGSFEAGMDGYGIGQTREHAQLIRSFGVEQIIIAVNKMDIVEYCKERFDFIKLQLSSFLRSLGFKESSVTWIPLSAMENQNLMTDASDVRLSCWYKGPCLLSSIDSLQPPHRDVLKPLLLPICDAISSHSLGHVAACGKLERGAIRSGSKVHVMPSGDVATVKAIERDGSPCTVGRAGDNIAVSLQGVDGSCVIPGGVLCHPDFPVTIASKMELKILVLEIVTPILVGSQVEFHIHHAKTVARVAKILSLIDQKTGKSSKRPPRLLTAKQSALIEVSLDGAVCVEEFTNCRVLGRVILRAAGNTIAVGIVTRVIRTETASSSGTSERLP